MIPQPLPELQALLAEAAAAAPALDPTLPLEQVREACDEGILRLHHLVRDHGPLREVRDLEVAGVLCIQPKLGGGRRGVTGDGP